MDWHNVIWIGAAVFLVVCGWMSARRLYAKRGSWLLVGILAAVIAVGTAVPSVVMARVEQAKMEIANKVVQKYKETHPTDSKIAFAEKVPEVYLIITQRPDGKLIAEMLVGSYWVNLGEVPTNQGTPKP